MSYNNQPRIPVRFLPHNEELVKAQSGDDHKPADYREELTVATVLPGVQHSYRTPAGRVSGNDVFRRYTNGSLDLDYACAKIVQALHLAKDGGGVDVLNGVDKIVLSVLFPTSFDTVGSQMAGHVAHVQLRITPEEVQMLRMKVAAKLAEELNWNAGMGGGSVPGRSSTRS
jgi:hypothetical protein